MGAKRTKAQQKRYLAKIQKRRKAIKRVEGLLNNVTGFMTERKFFESFRSGDLPEWLYKIRKAGRKLDKIGVDAIAETDLGNFYLQIKSSELRALQFKSKPNHENIFVVVALRKDTPEFIRYDTISKLQDARQKLINENRPVT